MVQVLNKEAKTLHSRNCLLVGKTEVANKYTFMCPVMEGYKEKRKDKVIVTE